MTRKPITPANDQTANRLSLEKVVRIHPLHLSSQVPPELVPPIHDFIEHCDNSLYSLEEAVMTGYEVIDQDHHDIALLVNAAEYFAVSVGNRELTGAVLDELAMRCAAHFQYEESQFLPNGAAFPDAHQVEHGRLLRLVGELQDQVRLRGLLPGMREFLYLHDLFRRHSRLDRALIDAAQAAGLEPGTGAPAIRVAGAAATEVGLTTTACPRCQSETPHRVVAAAQTNEPILWCQSCHVPRRDGDALVVNG